MKVHLLWGHKERQGMEEQDNDLSAKEEAPVKTGPLTVEEVEAASVENPILDKLEPPPPNEVYQATYEKALARFNAIKEDLDNKEEEPKPRVFGPYPRTMYHKDGILSSRLIGSKTEELSMGDDWTSDKPEPLPKRKLNWPASPSTIGTVDPKAKLKMANDFI